MHFEIAKKWTKALRSAKYAQGAFNLYHEPSGEYCCLGVLCDLYQEEHKNDISKLLFIAKEESSGVVYYDNENESLPMRVMDWAGMQTRNGRNSRRNWNNEDYCKIDLATMNDGCGGENRKSFREIADYIEDNYMYL